MAVVTHSGHHSSLHVIDGILNRMIAPHIFNQTTQ